MLKRSNILVLFAALGGLMSLLAPVAHAGITTSIAEVRGSVVYVKGSGAGRKDEIFWDYGYGYNPVTTANGKGNFSFEGELPAGCPPDNCVGRLTAGDPGNQGIPVDITYSPSGPPGDPPDELCLMGEQSDSHGGDAVRAVGFVVDGEGVAQVVSGGADTHLRYWPLDLYTYVVDLILPNIPYHLDVSADGSMFATGEGGWKGHAGADTLRIWDAAGEPLTATQAPIGFVYSVAVSPVAADPNTYWVAASGFYGDILLYLMEDGPAELPTLTLNSTTDTRKKRTTALDISLAGLVASASTGGIEIRSVPEDCTPGNCALGLPRTLNHPSSWSASIAFVPNSTTEVTKLVSGTDSGETKLWNIENLAQADEMVSVRSVDSGPVYALAVSEGGAMIVAGGNRDLTVYDANNLEILFRTEDAHAGRVNDVALSPGNALIVSGGADGALKLWRFPTPESPCLP